MVGVCDVSGGRSAVVPQTAAAAAMQVGPCGRGGDIVMRVCNAGEADVTVRLKAGDGPRAPLGDKDIAVPAGETVYIPLYDTARHRRVKSGAMDVELRAEDGGALSAEVLAGIGIEVLQI